MKKLAIIYDLDNTIFRTQDIGKHLFKEVFHAIVSSNETYLAHAEEIRGDLHRLSLVEVGRKYSFQKSTIESIVQALESTEFEERIFPYEDCHIIDKLPVKSFLVTSGNKTFQSKKIKSLNIGHLFDEIHIDDDQSSIGKEAVFMEILSQLVCDPEQVLVVGDNTESEIKAGNRLGMHTVQILREGVEKKEGAKSYIHSLVELANLLN